MRQYKRHLRAIGLVFRTQRIEVGLTQNELAEKFGFVSAQYISNIERGVVLPPTKRLKKFCKVLELDREQCFKMIAGAYEALIKEELSVR